MDALWYSSKSGSLLHLKYAVQVYTEHGRILAVQVYRSLETLLLAKDILQGIIR